MITAYLISLSSPDALDLENCRIPTKDLEILLEMSVGSSDAEGEELFQLMLISVERLNQSVAREGPRILNHHLVVEEYDYNQVKNTLIRLCEGCSGESWKDVRRELSQIGESEFANYRDSTDPGSR